MLGWKDQTNKFNNATWKDEWKDICERLETLDTMIDNTKKNRTFQNSERKFYQQIGWQCIRTNQQLDAKEAKQSWSKICEDKEYNRKVKWINNMKKELYGLVEGWDEHKHGITQQHLKKYQIGKHLFIMVYIVSGFKNSRPSTTDWLFNQVDVSRSKYNWMDD